MKMITLFLFSKHTKYYLTNYTMRCIVLCERSDLVDTQLKRGLLEVCVLTAIKKEDSYGYKIIKDISPYVSISESTLYPILKRLENSGFITVYTVEHNSRLRKYYRITDTGRNRIFDFLDEWKSVMKAYDFIKEGYNHE